MNIRLHEKVYHCSHFITFNFINNISRDVKWKIGRSDNELTWKVVTVINLREAGNSKTLNKFRVTCKPFHPKGIAFYFLGYELKKQTTDFSRQPGSG